MTKICLILLVSYYEDAMLATPDMEEIEGKTNKNNFIKLKVNFQFLLKYNVNR